EALARMRADRPGDDREFDGVAAQSRQALAVQAKRARDRDAGGRAQQLPRALAREVRDPLRRIENGARPALDHGPERAQENLVLVRLADGDESEIVTRKRLRHRS